MTEQERPKRNLEEGKGVLLLNTYSTNPKAPKWRGSIKIDGATVKLAGWEIKGYDGNPLISLAVDNWVPTGQPRTYPREVKSYDDDQDIPF